MDRLSGDYNRGYTRAIQDVCEEVKGVQNNLIHYHKHLNFKLIIKVLELFLQNCENFREHRNGFIRWNVKKEELEFYKPN